MAKKEMAHKVPAVPAVTDLLSGKKEPASKKSKRKHRQTIIDHHTDGKTHTARHIPADGGEEISYAGDLDAMHDGLEEHLGEPNEGEGAA